MTDVSGYSAGHGLSSTRGAPTRREREAGELEVLAPERQAYWALRAGFTAAPILAGIDKYTNVLTSWEKYLAPQVSAALGVRPRTFMRLVGGVEVAAGLAVAARPRLGAPVVAAWLGGIMGNLILARRDYDVALRDLGLAIGAFALWRLAVARGA
jgi:uncharacterized membrane protein YphA (DoxX/SURF4 family)